MYLVVVCVWFFFFKQKTAYEMRISDWSSDVCSSDLTLVGGIAVLLWALLALFTTGAAGIPPFQLLAMTFAVAFVVSLAVLATRGRGAFVAWRQAPAVWALGVGGLFGYHFFYFVALGNAPAVDASLIAYLWPLQIGRAPV